MSRRWTCARIAVAAGAALTLCAVATGAQVPLFERGGWSADLGVSVHTLTAVHDAGFEYPDAASARRTGLAGQVARLRGRLRCGPSLLLEVHDRLQAQVLTAGAALGATVAGIGVSAVPARPVDLRSHLVDDAQVQVWHDVDRLALTAHTVAADVTLGRQAITWGTAALFPVADVWAGFSPFELDTEEKAGVDAARLLLYPRPELELDAVVAARSRASDLSAGVSATLDLRRADLYGAVAKVWREAMALAGVTLVCSDVSVRAEGATVWDLDDGELGLPRATVGVDWIHGRLVLSGEYHLNGAGAAHASGYLAQLTGSRFARGEGYYLGRHYLGGTVAYAPGQDGRTSLSLTGLANVSDPSLSLGPAVSYDVAQGTSVAAGALLAFGRTPVLALPAPRLRSEFGSYGDLYYSRVSVYF